MSPRKVVLALDESKQSRLAVDWAARNLIRRQHDVVTLIYVLPASVPVVPAMPVATAASMVAVHQQWEAQKAHNEHIAAETLKQTESTLVNDYKVTKENVHMHVLPATGGASGVAESVTEFVKLHHSDVLVVGCRGMGAIKRACMSFIGLGSVSDYCLHNAVIPTLVVRFAHGKEPVLGAEACPPPTTPLPKKVVVCTDDSPISHHALMWALENLLLPHDHLHLVSVAVSVPYPILDEPAAVAGMQAQEYADEKEEVKELSKNLTEKAADAAMQHGVLRAKITCSVLTPNGGGASDVGSSICQYATDKGADLLVVGSRGLGAVARSVMGMMGLGSVSDYLSHNGPCPILVVKHDDAAGGAAGGAEEVVTHAHDGILLPRVDEAAGEESKDD